MKTFEIGTIVKFKPTCYDPAYGRFYDSYKGHQFKVTGFMPDDENKGEFIIDHVSLINISCGPQVEGFVHAYDLEEIYG